MTTTPHRRSTAPRIGKVGIQGIRAEDGASSDPGGALAREIVARATSGASQDHPVVLLHDGGGYRGADVDALPAVIAYYRAAGYTFVRLDGR